MSEVTSKQIAEWRALQGEGMISAVGEYTPDEFWIVLDELAARDARIAEQDVQIKVLQSNANSWQSGYDEGRRMGGKHCMLTVDQQAQRIAELEGLLRHAQKQVPTGSGLHMRIDAALAAHRSTGVV